MEVKYENFFLKVVLKEEDDGRWCASIPALPGCSSWGYSRQEALDNIKDAAEIYIEDMVDAGESVPRPSDEIELLEEPAIAVSLGFINSKIPLSEKSSRLSNKMDFNIEGAREAKGFIARDGRRAILHFHHAKDTSPIGTLQSFLNGTKWNEDDLKRLGLIT